MAFLILATDFQGKIRPAICAICERGCLVKPQIVFPPNSTWLSSQGAAGQGSLTTDAAEDMCKPGSFAQSLVKK